MRIWLIFLLIYFSALSTYGQKAGDLDHSFNYGKGTNYKFNYGYGTDGNVKAIALQPDGKIIIGGDFGRYNGIRSTNIARLNLDGSLDTSFNSNLNYDESVTELILQSDGKILISLEKSLKEPPEFWILRLNNNGSEDTTFKKCGELGGDYPRINALIIQPDGKILVGGRFTRFKKLEQPCLIRLNANGEIDTSFTTKILLTYSTNNPSVNDIAIQEDGKIIVGGEFTQVNGREYDRIAKLNNNGTLDSAFKIGVGFNEEVKCLAIQSDGKIIAGGNFSYFNNYQKSRLSRLNADGSIDQKFDIGTGISADFKNSVNDIAIEKNGKIIIVGCFDYINLVERNSIGRLTSNGEVDTSFNSTTAGDSESRTVYKILIQPDGKVLIAQACHNANGNIRNGISRLQTNGKLDYKFCPETGPNDVIRAVVVQLDGKILIGGDFNRYNYDLNFFSIRRLNIDGSIDSTFKPDKNAWGNIYSMALLPNGKILIGGYLGAKENYSTSIIRLHKNGSLDTAFNFKVKRNDYYNVCINSINILSNSKILVGGSFSEIDGEVRNGIARINYDGSLDKSFIPEYAKEKDDFHSTINCIKIQPDGKVLVGGIFNTYKGKPCYGLIRLNKNGKIDNTFSTRLDQLFDYAVVNTIALQPNGKILIGGRFNIENDTLEKYIYRLNANGTIDKSFKKGLDFAGDDAKVNSIKILKNGIIAVAGDFHTYNGILCDRLVMLNPNGTLISKLNNGKKIKGSNPSVECFAIQPDGKIVIAGGFTSYNGLSTPRIARIYGNEYQINKRK